MTLQNLKPGTFQLVDLFIFVTVFVFIFSRFAVGGGVTWTELGLGYGLNVESSNPGRGKTVFFFP